jgi:hypothetical protein
MMQNPQIPRPAPAFPQVGLRFTVATGHTCERYSVIAATNRSFTVHHAGRRSRYLRENWRGWLLQLCARGRVAVQDGPMLPPGAAALAGALLASVVRPGPGACGFGGRGSAPHAPQTIATAD